MGRISRLWEEESGAETGEIILALVLLVVGIVVAFAVLRDTLREHVQHSADCIDGAVEVTECGG